MSSSAEQLVILRRGLRATAAISESMMRMVYCNHNLGATIATKKPIRFWQILDPRFFAFCISSCRTLFAVFVGGWISVSNSKEFPGSAEEATKV